MIKYSACYVKINPNFVIQGLNDSDFCSPCFAIIQNILTRGCPTIPSLKLRNYKDAFKTADFKYCYDFSDLKWANTIKGGTQSNPAFDFYTNYIERSFRISREKANTFIPECSLTDIIEGFQECNNIESHVDFYSPLYKLVVEIDGSQHFENEQKIKDDRRDRLLKANGISIVRIPANNVSRVLLNKSLTPNTEYYNALFSNAFKMDNNDIFFVFAIRLQLVLLHLLNNKRIDLHDDIVNLNLLLDFDISPDDIAFIIDDFYDLVINVFAMQNIAINKPMINLKVYRDETELLKANGLKVDVSLIKLYSDEPLKDVIAVRNSYFLYEDKLLYDLGPSNSYPIRKNYYRVACAPIKYALEINKHADNLIYVLQNTSLKFSEFRANQLEIIVECLNKTGVVGILPTGAGKSLCYQLCAMLIPSISLVVAPLQLLMIDQRDNMVLNFGITNVTAINSMCVKSGHLLEYGKATIAIISPERFFSESFDRILEKLTNNVGFIVIDEVHCLSEWGHDFRTSYLCLAHNLKKYFPSSTYLMALTGTASHRVFDDIEAELSHFKNNSISSIFANDMRRNNLEIFISKPDNIYQAMLDVILPTIKGQNADKTLVFTKKKSSIAFRPDSSCITLSNLVARDYADIGANKVVTYYAGGDALENEEKIKILEEFKGGAKKVVFATKAFGMGVDVPDIRNTIHYGLPSSLESLYQEMGRAGRDGEHSRCFVFYQEENPITLNNFFRRPIISMAEIKSKMKYLKEFRTNFFFIQNSNLDCWVEKNLIETMYAYIKEKINGNKYINIECESFVNDVFKNPSLNELQIRDLIGEDVKQAATKHQNVLSMIEKTLYRLFVLGEIEMWNIVYGTNIANPVFSNIRLTSHSEESKLNILRNHILKYETSFDYSGGTSFGDRLEFLIRWVNDNYLTERIQTMKTLYDECESFTSSDSFMDFISNYFSNDPVYTRLLSKQCRVADWLDALKPPPEITKTRISRLLESYDKVASLNYVSGITRLRIGEFEDFDGRHRLEQSFGYIAKLRNVEKQKLFSKTYSLLNEEQKNCFVECWLQYMSEDAKFIYERTQNEIAESHLVYKYINELLIAGGRFNDRFK